MPTLVTMTISGMWHGAGPQFICWGLLHGVYLSINQSWRMVRPRFWRDQSSYDRIMKPLGWILTFSSVVVALVFFRARSVDDALAVLAGMFGMSGVWPYDVQLLQSSGIDPVVAMRQLQPLRPFLWIAVLLAWVLLLPNSLELLRRFEPTLDFPPAADAIPKPASDQSAAPVRWGPPTVALQMAWSSLQRARFEGVRSEKWLAVMAALLGMLGVMAIGASGAFLYGAF
jgi:hypothetical protein